MIPAIIQICRHGDPQLRGYARTVILSLTHTGKLAQSLFLNS